MLFSFNLNFHLFISYRKRRISSFYEKYNLCLFTYNVLKKQDNYLISHEVPVLIVECLLLVAFWRSCEMKVPVMWRGKREKQDMLNFRSFASAASVTYFYNNVVVTMLMNNISLFIYLLIFSALNIIHRR